MKLTKPTSRSCRGTRPPSTTSVAPRRESHTYGEDDDLRAPIQGRAAEDLDRKTSSTAECVWWGEPLLGATPMAESRVKERERNWFAFKGMEHLYIKGSGGCNSPWLSHVGLNPTWPSRPRRQPAPRWAPFGPPRPAGPPPFFLFFLSFWVFSPNGPLRPI